MKIWDEVWGWWFEGGEIEKNWGNVFWRGRRVRLGNVADGKFDGGLFNGIL